MGAKSAIEWTDATWNPVTGCTKITRGCDHCYAARFAERWRGVSGHPYEQGFDLRQWPSRLDQPARWRKPRMIFVNSMSDLFHKNVERSFPPVRNYGLLHGNAKPLWRLVQWVLHIAPAPVSPKTARPFHCPHCGSPMRGGSFIPNRAFISPLGPPLPGG